MKAERVLEPLVRFGFGRESLELYDSIIGLPNCDYEINTTPGTVPDSEKTVLFPYAYQAESHRYKYSILAQAFKTRGYKPLFVLPNKCLPVSCLKEYELDEKTACEVREFATEKILREFGHDWVYLTDYISDHREYEGLAVDEFDLEAYNGINLIKFSRASTRKVGKKYHINTEADQRIQRDFLRSGVLLVDAYKKLIESRDVVTIIGHDDKYTDGGVPLAVCDNNGIHAYSTTYGWRNSSLVLGNVAHRNSLPHYEDEGVVDRFLKEPLDEKQLNRVTEIMNGRMAGRDESRARYSAQTQTSIKPSEDQVTVGMFTNLIWDANMEVTDCPYPDVFDWIRDTISQLGGSSNVELIIKPHPAEDSRGTNESVRDWILSNYQELPENVEVLSSDTDINTYSMIEDIDVGVVYNSTVGFEMVYAGVPAITAGETHYRNLDISLDPENTDQYIDLLKNISQISCDPERQRRAKRYIYFLLEGKHLDFPFIYTDEEEGRTYKYNEVTDSDIRDNEVFDQIVKRCTTGEPVFIPELDWLITPRVS